MYKIFKQHFFSDELGMSRTAGVAPDNNDASIAGFFSQFGSMSFNQGLYRTMRPGTVEQWEALVADAFPGFRGFASCFAFDWLGRVFALDSRRLEQGNPGVVMFEPGTGEALEIPCNIVEFHENELIEHQDAALAASFHAQWLASGGRPPNQQQCIGYKKPLFLGGKDTVENLEVQDLDVYWTFAAQLIRKVKGLPAGKIVKITGKDSGNQ